MRGQVRASLCIQTMLSRRRQRWRACLQELALFPQHVYTNPCQASRRHRHGRGWVRLMNERRFTNRCNYYPSPRFAFLPFLSTSIFRVYLAATSLPGTLSTPSSLPLTQPLSPERPEEKCCYTGLRETSLARDLCLSNIPLYLLVISCQCTHTHRKYTCK